jgi:pyruvate/2-oxoglutarate/acetoin dehydrogenase E1 component
MRTTFAGAIRKTLKEEMEQNEQIFLLGEDIRDPYGGIHKVTLGLTNHFGKDRVINSPLSEIAIAGAGVGSAISGMRPVIEIMYADFLPIAMDQIVNGAAKMHFLSHGKIKCPLVIRVNFGGGKGEGAQHSQSPEAWFMNFPGIKIVCPSTPRDAQGLLKSSIEDNNPVLFLEHKLLYGMKGEILNENIPISIGKAEVKRQGKDITIVVWSIMVHKALAAAEELANEGIEAEVVDLRTIKPVDKGTICDSVCKTGRLLTVEENPYTGGVGAQIVDTVVAEAFEYLKCAPVRLTTPDVPLPAMKEFENILIPDINKIINAVRNIVNSKLIGDE